MPANNCFNWICFRGQINSWVKRRISFFCITWWKAFYASVFTCASSFVPHNQRYPRDVFSRLFDLKCNHDLNRKGSDCTDVQFCFVGWNLSHQRRTRRKGKNLWVWLPMRVCVRVSLTAWEICPCYISCENKMATLCLTVGREFYKSNTLQREQKAHCVMALCDTLLMLKQATISY